MKVHIYKKIATRNLGFRFQRRGSMIFVTINVNLEGGKQ